MLELWSKCLTWQDVYLQQITKIFDLCLIKIQGVILSITPWFDHP